MKSIIDYPEEVALLSSSLSDLPVTWKVEEKTALADADETVLSHFHTDSESEETKIDNPLVVSDDESDSSSSDEKGPRKKRNVSFGPIHVRQFERIVGDHPQTKVGVPLGIGWAYYEDEKNPTGISIDRYESDRIQRDTFRMTSITRRNMLKYVFQIPEDQLAKAEKRVEREQKSTKHRSSQAKSFCKKLGKKIRQGGMAFLKGMSYAGQVGISNGDASTSTTNSLSAAAGHMF